MPDAPSETPATVWLWCVRCRINDRHGVLGASDRAYSPEDVIQCVDRLYRQRRIDLMHARVLRIWGERQEIPAVEPDARIWNEAMDRLDRPMRKKGIIQ